MIKRNKNGTYALKSDYEIGDLEMELCISQRRKELLTEWLNGQINEINEIGAKSATGAFFSFLLTPSGIGASLQVYCKATGKVLDLSLIDDEEW